MKLALPAALGLSLLAACQRGGGPAPNGSSERGATGALPPGMCACPCAGGAAASAAQGNADVGELSASANRKMLHDDGAGCLADLDALARADPKLEQRLAIVRGQCEMLVGKCQQGKQRVAAYYVTETNLSQELADKSAESLASLRCRGGDSTDRDALLRAYQELSDGAYMTTHTSAACQKSLDDARRLAPRVQAKPYDDQAISGGRQALFFTAAQCFARAGDCTGAWRAFHDEYPWNNLTALTDQAQRDKVVKDSFDSTIERCKPR